MRAKVRPIRSRQYQDCQPPLGQILLMAKILIGRHQRIEPCFGRRQELAVIKLVPSYFIGC